MCFLWTLIKLVAPARALGFVMHGCVSVFLAKGTVSK